MSGPATSVAFDAATASLAVLGPGRADSAVVTVMPAKGRARELPLPGPATAMTGNNSGHVYASTRGGYFRVDIADGRVTRVEVDGQGNTDFTAIARRADGKLVLGSADGAVYTLSSDTTVGAQLKIFARVDALVMPPAPRPNTRCVPVKERPRWQPIRSDGCWSPTPAAMACWSSAPIR